MKLFFILLLVISPLASDRRRAGTFTRLYALEGCWIMPTKKGSIGEEWKKINDAYLQSRGFFVHNGDTTINERVAITQTKQGIFYTSTVENQNNGQAIPFKLTTSANDVFVFENAQHDYPKRITYALINKDSINARIDDGTDAPGKSSVFHYRRVR